MDEVAADLGGALDEVGQALSTGSYERLNALALRLDALEVALKAKDVSAEHLAFAQTQAHRIQAMLDGAREGLSEALTLISKANQVHDRLGIYTRDGARMDVAGDSRHGRTA